MKKRNLLKRLLCLLMVFYIVAGMLPGIELMPLVRVEASTVGVAPFPIGFLDPITPIELPSVAISTRTQLQNMTPGGRYHLTQSIDLRGTAWSPIANFTGIFDGQGHSINNLFVTNQTLQNSGLFGQITGATIRNVIVNICVTHGITGRDYVGGLVGRINGIGNVIRNSYVTGGSVWSSDSRAYVGGLIGGSPCIHPVGITIEAAFTTNVMNAVNSEHAGGLIGHIAGHGLIDRTFATGNVTTANNFAGGLIGCLNGVGAGFEIRNSFAIGNVTIRGRSAGAGGLIGTDMGGNTFRNVYASGDIRVNSYFTGGLIGDAGTSSIISGYRLEGGGRDISAANNHHQNTRGTAITAAQLSNRTNPVPTGWDFETIWGWDTSPNPFPFPILNPVVQVHTVTFYHNNPPMHPPDGIVSTVSVPHNGTTGFFVPDFGTRQTMHWRCLDDTGAIFLPTAPPITVTGDRRFEAVWQGFRVTFDANGGEHQGELAIANFIDLPRPSQGMVVSRPVSPVNDPVWPAPIDPTFPGRVFSHWSENAPGPIDFFAGGNRTIIRDTILFANWTITQCLCDGTPGCGAGTGGGGTGFVVRFYEDDARSRLHDIRFPAPNTTIGPIGPTVTDPDRVGQRVLRWRCYHDGTIFTFGITRVVRDMILIPEWEYVFIVDFDLNGSPNLPGPPFQLIDYNRTASQPAEPTRNRYVFLHWSSVQDGSSGAFNFSTPITQNETLWAQWIPCPNPFQITATVSSGRGGTIRADVNNEYPNHLINPTPTSDTYQGLNGGRVSLDYRIVFTASPLPGWEVSGWFNNGVFDNGLPNPRMVGSDSSNPNVFTVENIRGQHNVTVTFRRITRPVHVNVHPCPNLGSGTINLNTSGFSIDSGFPDSVTGVNETGRFTRFPGTNQFRSNVPLGANITITALPAPGFRVQHWDDSDDPGAAMANANALVYTPSSPVATPPPREIPRIIDLYFRIYAAPVNIRNIGLGNPLFANVYPVDNRHTAVPIVRVYRLGTNHAGGNNINPSFASNNTHDRFVQLGERVIVRVNPGAWRCLYNSNITVTALNWTAPTIPHFSINPGHSDFVAGYDSFYFVMPYFECHTQSIRIDTLFKRHDLEVHRFEPIHGHFTGWFNPVGVPTGPIEDTRLGHPTPETEPDLSLHPPYWGTYRCDGDLRNSTTTEIPRNANVVIDAHPRNGFQVAQWRHNNNPGNTVNIHDTGQRGPNTQYRFINTCDDFYLIEDAPGGRGRITTTRIEIHFEKYASPVHLGDYRLADGTLYAGEPGSGTIRVSSDYMSQLAGGALPYVVGYFYPVPYSVYDISTNYIWHERKVTITVQPDAGWYFDGYISIWVYNGDNPVREINIPLDGLYEPGHHVRTFTMPALDCHTEHIRVAARFRPLYTIIVMDVSENMFGVPFMAMRNIANLIVKQMFEDGAEPYIALVAYNYIPQTLNDANNSLNTATSVVGSGTSIANTGASFAINLLTGASANAAVTPIRFSNNRQDLLDAILAIDVPRQQSRGVNNAQTTHGRICMNAGLRGAEALFNRHLYQRSGIVTDTVSGVHIILLSNGLTWDEDLVRDTAGEMREAGYYFEARSFFHAIGRSYVPQAPNAPGINRSPRILMNYINCDNRRQNREYGRRDTARGNATILAQPGPVVVTADWWDEDFYYRWNLNGVFLYDEFLQDVADSLMGVDGFGNPLAALNPAIGPSDTNANVRQIGIFHTPLDMVQTRDNSTGFTLNIPVGQQRHLPFNFGVVIGTGEIQNMFDEQTGGYIATGNQPQYGSLNGTYAYLGLRTRDAIDFTFEMVSNTGRIRFESFYASRGYRSSAIGSCSFGVWILGDPSLRYSGNSIAFMGGLPVSVSSTRPRPAGSLPTMNWNVMRTNIYVPIGGDELANQPRTQRITQHLYRFPFAGRTYQFHPTAVAPVITAGQPATINMAIANRLCTPDPDGHVHHCTCGQIPFASETASAAFFRGHSVTTVERRTPYLNIIIDPPNAGAASGATTCCSIPRVAEYPYPTHMIPGSSIQLVATPNRWHSFSHWEVREGGANLNAIINNPEKMPSEFYMPDNNVTVIAHFEPLPMTHHIFLLDVSESMRGTKLAQMQVLTSELAEYLLLDNTVINQIGAITYTDDVINLFQDNIRRPNGFVNFPNDYIFGPGDSSDFHSDYHIALIKNTINSPAVNIRPGGTDFIFAMEYAEQMFPDYSAATSPLIYSTTYHDFRIAYPGRMHIFSDGLVTMPRTQCMPTFDAGVPFFPNSGMTNHPGRYNVIQGPNISANPTGETGPFAPNEYIHWRQANLTFWRARDIHPNFCIVTPNMQRAMGNNDPYHNFAENFMNWLVGHPCGNEDAPDFPDIPGPDRRPVVRHPAHARVGYHDGWIPITLILENDPPGFPAGAVVSITALDPPEGYEEYEFYRWTYRVLTAGQTVIFGNRYSYDTYFIMPDSTVFVYAHFHIPGPPPPPSYLVTVTTINGTSIGTTISDMHVVGERVYISAGGALPGHRFDMWVGFPAIIFGDGGITSDGLSLNTFFYMPPHPIEVQAIFVLIPPDNGGPGPTPYPPYITPPYAGDDLEVDEPTEPVYMAILSPANRVFPAMLYVSGTSPAAMAFTVTNVGTEPIRLTSAYVGVGGFEIVGGFVPVMVQPGLAATLWVRPRYDLPVGLHYGLLVVTGSNGIEMGSVLSVTVTDGPIYAVSVYPGFITFMDAQPGYNPAEKVRYLTITNTGTESLTNVQLQVGANAAFEIISPVFVPVMTSGSAISVQVRPVGGLPASDEAYTDTLRITADNGILLEVPLSFVVSEELTFKAVITPGSFVFASMLEGYDGVGLFHTFVLTNMGTGYLTGLHTALGSGDFVILFDLFSPVLAPGASETIMVHPANHLTGRNTPYTDVLTIRGDNGILLTVPLSFRVYAPAPDIVLGDLTGTGTVDMSDLILFLRFFAPPGIEINLAAADVNQDGVVDMADLILLMRFFAQPGVVLGPQ